MTSSKSTTRKHLAVKADFHEKAVRNDLKGEAKLSLLNEKDNILQGMHEVL
jgi:hypothetical protein